MNTIKIYAGSMGSRIVTHNDHYRLLQGGMIYAAGPLAMCLSVADAFGWTMKLKSGCTRRLTDHHVAEVYETIKNQVIHA